MDDRPLQHYSLLLLLLVVSAEHRLLRFGAPLRLLRGLLLLLRLLLGLGLALLTGGVG